MMRSRMTPNSLFTMNASEVIQSVHDRIVSDLPEQGVNTEDDLERIEVALGRLSNDYAYVIELLCYSRNYVRQLKRAGEKERYEDMMDIRDGLESISSALKMKYQATSRILTVHEQRTSENGMHPFRKGGGQN